MVNGFYCAKWRTPQITEPSTSGAEKKICCTCISRAVQCLREDFFRLFFNFSVSMSTSAAIVQTPKAHHQQNAEEETITRLYT